MHNVSCNASSWNFLLFMHHLLVICKHVARCLLSLCRTGQPKVVCTSTYSWLHFCLRNKCLLGQSLDPLEIPSLYIFISYICGQSCWTIGQLILSEVELQTAIRGYIGYKKGIRNLWQQGQLCTITQKIFKVDDYLGPNQMSCLLLICQCLGFNLEIFHTVEWNVAHTKWQIWLAEKCLQNPWVLV